MALPGNDDKPDNSTSRPGSSPGEPTGAAAAPREVPDDGPDAGEQTTAAGLKKRVPFREPEPAPEANPQEPSGRSSPRSGAEAQRQAREALDRLRGSAPAREAGSGPGEPAAFWDGGGPAPAAPRLPDAWAWPEEPTSPGTAGAGHDTAVTRESGSGGTGDGKPPRKRSRALMLVGAALVGALLVAVPLLISGGGGSGSSTSVRAGSPAAQDDSTGLADTAGSPRKSPSPRASGAESPQVSPSRSAPRGGASGGPAGKPSGGVTSPADGGGAVPGGTEQRPATTGTVPATDPAGPGKQAPPAGDTAGDTTAGQQIYSLATGRCIGIVGSPGAVSGAQLEIWDCEDVAWHKWTLPADGTVRSQGKCMNVGGGSTQDGAGIGWVTCNGTGGQQFRLNAAHDLTNPQSGNKCVDVKDNGTANGTRLQLWGCSGSPNQKWSLR